MPRKVPETKKKQKWQNKEKDGKIKSLKEGNTNMEEEQKEKKGNEFTHFANPFRLLNGTYFLCRPNS